MSAARSAPPTATARRRRAGTRAVEASLAGLGGDWRGRSALGPRRRFGAGEVAPGRGSGGALREADACRTGCSRPAPVETRPPRPLAPSALGEDDVADPPPTPALRAGGGARQAAPPAVRAAARRRPGRSRRRGRSLARTLGRRRRRRASPRPGRRRLRDHLRSALCRSVRPRTRSPRRRSPR